MRYVTEVYSIRKAKMYDSILDDRNEIFSSFISSFNCHQISLIHNPPPHLV